MTQLKFYSDDELIEELVKRRNNRRDEMPEHWCTDCRNFVAWNEAPRPRKAEMPDNFNACTKGHTMQFVTPQDIDDDYGFYRRICTDWDAA